MEFYDIRLLECADALDIDKRIVIYGAGEKGREIARLLHEAEIKVDFFCDRNKKIDGDIIAYNIGCVHTEKIVSILETYREIVYLIVCVEHPQDVWDFFSNQFNGGICEIRFVTYWGICQFFYQNLNSFFHRSRFFYNMYILEDNIKKRRLELIGFNMLKHLACHGECNDEIWVVHPGKTGSTSVCEMLIKAGIRVWHSHVIAYPEHILSGFEEMWNNVLNRRLQRKLKIICFVRNPLDRDYSAFWQPFSIDNPRKCVHSFPTSMQEKYDEFIRNVVLNDCGEKIYALAKPQTWNDEFRWFDQELKRGIGIDIYDYPFDVEKGWNVIESSNIEIFIGKLEKMNNLLPYLSDFVGARLFSTHANDASKKWYSMAYKDFRRHVKITQEYVGHYFEGNKKVDHFYDEAEKREFRNAWVFNIRDGVI